MADYRAEARRAAQRHGLDPTVFERQIKQESGFNPRARSPAGALGIAQIMPQTARGWGVDPMNPRQALDKAAGNMARYVKQFGSYDKALRAYNAGPGNVEKSKGFAETNHYVRTILGGRDPGGLSTPRSTGGSRASAASISTPGTPGTPGRTITTTTPGVDNSATRNALLSSFLNDKNSDILDFATQIQGLSDTPATSTSRTIPGTPGTPGTPGSVGAGGSKATADQLVKRADAIDSQHLPYKWGGGHAGQTSIHAAVPLDCSGAVSKVLGIDPRVAADFAKWGSPGAGSGKGVTIYSKPTHVLMRINGHFFGTSGSNPGGGAGWIKQDQVSPEYLAGFTARHSAR